jgi:hypothetical protein
MTTFKRQIGPEKLEALAALAEREGNWWHDLLSMWAPSGHDGELRLAIRDGYLNLYSMGQSVAKVSFVGDQPRLSVHHKYVGCDPIGSAEYLSLLPEEGRDAQGTNCIWGGKAMLRTWIANSVRHRGIEKRFVERSVADSSGVIDLEMGLPAEGDRKTPLRMDLVALEPMDGAVRVVFWEAKMIDDARLRSREFKPEVLENQVKGYSTFLASPSNERAVLDAYRQTCVILKAIHEMALVGSSTPALDPLITDVALGIKPMTLDPEPRIIVYDDGRRRDPAAWQKHLDFLRQTVTVHVVPALPYRLPTTSAAS